MQRLFRWLAATAAFVVLAACGGPAFQPPGDAPVKWQESMRKESQGGWVVWGYGSGSDPDSLTAGRSQAESHARNDLAERTNARLQALQERLIKRLGGKGNKDLEKADIRAVVKRAGEIAVNSAVVERRLRDEGGTWHALTRTELRPALREAAENRGLSASAVDSLMTEADGMLSGKGGGAE